MNRYIRFLSHADTHGLNPDVCWEWCGADKGNGYGNYNLDGHTMSAHKAAHLLFVGYVPPKMDVCHTCDNRACVNPDHLFVGSRKENMEDAARKMRTARGSRLRNTKLDEGKVLEIKQRIALGHPAKDIGADYGVHHATINAIRRGITWTHVSMESH